MSAHPKADPRTGELLFFNYATEAPYLHYGVLDPADELVHYVGIELPGPRLPHDMAFTWAATGKPAWFLFDGLVRHEERFSFGDNVFGSEAAMAPRPGGTAEDDGYLVTLTTDMNADASFCVVLDAGRPADGPVCVLRLPERISSGTHATWAAGADLPGWRDSEDPACAVGR